MDWPISRSGSFFGFILRPTFTAKTINEPTTGIKKANADCKIAFFRSVYLSESTITDTVNQRTR